MAADDGLMNTKWGRISSQEWLRRRYLEDLERWLPPEKLHLIFTRTPYHDAFGVEIRDFEFEALVRSDPDAAWQQLEAEFVHFRHQLRFWLAGKAARQAAAQAEAKAARAAQKAKNAAAVRSYISRRRKRSPATTHQPTLLPD